MTIQYVGNTSKRQIDHYAFNLKEGLDGLAISHSQVYSLRCYDGNLLGNWCHVVEFACEEGLHGLFSGMIIFDKMEANDVINYVHY